MEKVFIEKNELLKRARELQGETFGAALIVEEIEKTPAVTAGRVNFFERFKIDKAPRNITAIEFAYKLKSRAEKNANPWVDNRILESDIDEVLEEMVGAGNEF